LGFMKMYDNKSLVFGTKILLGPWTNTIVQL